MTHIDYIAFSVSLANRRPKINFDQLSDFLPEHCRVATPTRISRKPYRVGLRHAGASVFSGGHDTALIEVSGAGLAQMTAQEIGNYMHTVGNIGVDSEHDFMFLRFVRIDLANDYDLDLSPTQILERIGVNTRLSTRASMNSASGKTEYIGSRKSDKFFRVYRYEQPHPRAGFPRIELQSNKRIADNIAWDIIKNRDASDLVEVIAGIMNGYMRKTFNSPELIQDMATTLDVQLSGMKKNNADTLRWFYVAVVPALRKLIADNEISLIDIVEAIGTNKKHGGV